MKKTITSMLLILPLILLSAIILDETTGVLAGEGHASTHDFTVTATQFNLSISEPNENGVRSIKLIVPVKEIDTGIGMRNTHMRTSMFDMKKNPDIIFTAKTTASLTAGEVILNGALTINGVTNNHELHITVSENAGDLVAIGKTTISLENYDLPLLGMGPMKLLDQVDMAFNIVLPNK